jgi:hypothetical protein
MIRVLPTSHCHQHTTLNNKQAQILLLRCHSHSQVLPTEHQNTCNKHLGLSCAPPTAGCTRVHVRTMPVRTHKQQKGQHSTTAEPERPNHQTQPWTGCVALQQHLPHDTG